MRWRVGSIGFWYDIQARQLIWRGGDRFLICRASEHMFKGSSYQKPMTHPSISVKLLGFCCFSAWAGFWLLSGSWNPAQAGNPQNQINLFVFLTWQPSEPMFKGSSSQKPMFPGPPYQLTCLDFDFLLGQGPGSPISVNLLGFFWFSALSGFWLLGAGRFPRLWLHPAARTLSKQKNEGNPWDFIGSKDVTGFLGFQRI